MCIYIHTYVHIYSITYTIYVTIKLISLPLYGYTGCRYIGNYLI